MKSARSINGLLLVDKPQGFSSQKIVSKIKYLFKAEKAGHTGTLDPLATGMLPICLGEATKFSHYLLNAQKTYYVVAQLGVRTDTGDTEGEVIAESSVSTSMLQQLDETLKKFLGVIQQVPPMYSALKFQGQPLYKLARKGQIIERTPREVTIYSLQRIPVDNDTQFALEVTCSKGTYIRTLIEDIGNTLGCGAHVTVLRRLQVDNLSANNMITLSSIEALENEKDYAVMDKQLLPLTTLIEHLPSVKVSNQHGKRLLQGVTVPTELSILDSHVQIITESGIFLGIGEIQADGMLTPKRLMRYQTLDI